MQEWLPIDVSRVSTLEGPWRLSVVPQSGSPTELAAVLQRLFPPWLAAGARGGYAADHAPPWEASAVLQSAAGATGLEWVLDTHAFDVRALHILRSGVLHALVLARLGHEDAHELLEEDAVDRALGGALAGARLVARLETDEAVEIVRLPGTSWPPDHADDFELVLYPPASAQSGVTLTHIPREGMLRRCLVSMAGAADGALVARLTQFIQPWVRLLQQGCFEQPADVPGLTLPDFGAVQVFERHSLEIVVNRFDCDEGAWNVLFNLLAAFPGPPSITGVEVY